MAHRGRKICTHPVVTFKRKVEIPIYLNVHTGVFSAAVDGEWVKSDVLSDLRRIIEEVATESDVFEADDRIGIAPGVTLLKAET